MDAKTDQRSHNQYLEMITRTILYYMFYFNITFILYILDFQILSIHCLSSCINVCLTAFQSTFLLMHCMCKLIIYDLIDRAVFAFKETVQVKLPPLLLTSKRFNQNSGNITPDAQWGVKTIGIKSCRPITHILLINPTPDQ